MFRTRKLCRFLHRESQKKISNWVKSKGVYTQMELNLFRSVVISFCLVELTQVQQTLYKDMLPKTCTPTETKNHIYHIFCVMGRSLLVVLLGNYVPNEPC